MADRTWQPGEPELERALSELGARLAYPTTPDLARSVRTRLEAQPRVRRSWRQWLWPAPRQLAIALVGLLLLSLAVLALVPEARNAVAERLGLRGVTVEHLPTVPTATPTPPASPTPTPAPTPLPSATPAPLGSGLNLGQAVTLAEAQVRVAYPVVTPTLSELGAPDEVYLSPMPSGGQVSLVYRARPGLPAAGATGVGLLLTQFQGDLDPSLLGKGLGPGTSVQSVTVNGERGLWIEGQAHLLFYRDASGQVRDESVRLAGNVLLWERGTLTLRLESALARDEALRIAGAVH